ncbi:MAG: prohibitin family protein [Candidatus Pacebacteria bacterium]|nr:prohibitin family protein [Candidatus Paceibacterota bacterium]
MSDGDKTKLGIFGTIIIALFAIVVVGGVIVVLVGIETIQPGEAGIVFDKQKGVIEDRPLLKGWHWVNPVTKDLYVFDTKIQKKTLLLTAASLDSQIVTTEVTLNYQILATDWIWLIQEVGDMDLITLKIVDPQMKETLKASTAMFKGERLIPDRELVKMEVTDKLTKSLLKSRISVTEVSLTDFEFDEDYQNAIERKQVASQDVLTAENRLMEERIFADIIIVKSEAEAQAISNVGRAVAENPAIIDLEKIKRWDGIVSQYSVSIGSESGLSGLILNPPVPAST